MAPIMRLTLALLLSFTSLVASQDVPIPLTCGTGVQIIAVVGTNVSNGTQSYGRTASFVTDVLNAIPGSNSFSLNYNRFPGNLTIASQFVIEVDEGVPALKQALQNYTTGCPSTPVVLHGYSEGAVVVGNLLCGASSGSFPVTSPLVANYTSQIISVIFYGDEARTANQSYNEGGCNASAPHLARRNPAGCDLFAPVIQSYCFDDDTDCCSTANASAPYPFGIDPHYLYNEFDQDATAWVTAHYKTYKNISTISTSSSSTSTSSLSTTPTSSSTITTTSISSSSSSSGSTSSSSSPSKTTSSSSSSSSTTSSSSSHSSTSSSSSHSSTSSSSSHSSTSSSSSHKTTSTSSKTSATTKSKTTMSVKPSCSVDKCLSSFAAHPTTASRFCHSLASGKATASPFPTVCSGNYSSRVSSACSCLGITSSSTAATTTS